MLEKYSDISGQRIYELLKEKGYDGEITILRDYLKTIRQVVSKTPLRMVETDPGQLAAHDWSDYNITFTTGETRKVTFFSFILCYSRRQYVSVVEDKKQKTVSIQAELVYDDEARVIDLLPADPQVWDPAATVLAVRPVFQPACPPMTPIENKHFCPPSFLLVGRLKSK